MREPLPDMRPLPAPQIGEPLPAPQIMEPLPAPQVADLGSVAEERARLRAMEEAQATASTDPALVAYAQQLGSQARQDQAMSDASVAPPPREPVSFQRDVTARDVTTGTDATPAAAPSQAVEDRAPLTQFRADVRGGGVIPAHEVKLVGQTGQAAVDRSIAAGQEYARGADERATQIELANNEVVAASKAYNEALQAQYADQVAAQAKFEQESAQRQREIDNDVRQLSRLGVDTNRWWNNKNVIEQAAWKIGAALSAFVAGKNGTPDQAVQEYQFEVSKDVAAQEKSYDMAANNVAAKRSAFGQMVQRYGSAEAARGVLGAIKLQQFKNIAESAAAKIGTQEAKDKAAAIGMRAEQEAAKLIAGTVAFQQQQAIAPKTSYIDPETGLPLTQEQAFKVGMQEREARLKGGDERRKASNELGKLAVTLPDGTVRFAQNESGQKEAEKAVAGYTQIRDAYHKALALRSGIREAMTTGNAVRVGQLQQELNAHAVETAKRLETGQLGQGILREQEMPVMKNEVLAFTSLRPETDSTIRNRMAYGQKQLGIELQARAPMQGTRQIVGGIPQYAVSGEAEQTQQKAPASIQKGFAERR